MRTYIDKESAIFCSTPQARVKTIKGIYQRRRDKRRKEITSMKGIYQGLKDNNLVYDIIDIETREFKQGKDNGGYRARIFVDGKCIAHCKSYRELTFKETLGMGKGKILDGPVTRD